MKHFKKPDGSVWAFEDDGSQDELITDDMVAMNDDDVAAHQNPAPDPAQDTLAQIAALEASVTPRRVREVILSGNLGFIRSVEEEVARLREQLKEAV
jgi:hypothetical protein